ncbi:hypothetical protein DUGA6_63200 [Duganella sp. HH105]|nr:hypothetical protein DUGA6_63200 [Duganella sp. HH105]
MLEQGPHLHRHAAFAHPFEHAQRHQRMAAQFEEVILAPHLRHLQHLRPDLGQRLLHLTLGRFVFLATVVARLRQRLAIHLAVGVQRQAIEHHDRRRHHVVRQLLCQTRAQLAGVQRHPGLRRHVGDQPRAGSGAVLHHHRFAHLRLRQQLRLDFAQFDAEAANLDLMVDPAKIFQFALIVPAYQVARAVQALAVAPQRIGHEALRAQARTVQIAARQPDAAQIQLTSHAGRRQIQAVVENVGLRPADRPADRHLAVAIVAAGAVGDVDGRFGRAIQVIESSARQTLEHGVARLGRQGFAAADDARQAGTGFDALVRQEGLQHRRHEVQRGHAVAGDQLDQALRVAMVARVGDGQPGAGHQGPEEFPDRDVEAERRLLQHRVGRGQSIGLLHPRQAVVQRTMAVGRPLRTSRGTRGVDHIRQVLAVQCRLRIVRR